jgi:hypothetical protein
MNRNFIINFFFTLLFMSLWRHFVSELQPPNCIFFTPQTSISQTLAIEPLVVLGGSPCGPPQSAGGFGRKSIAKIVSDTKNENTPIHVCAKTALVT